MNFVIIGNGVAGVTAAFAIRERDPAASITLISGESDYFFSRTALMYAYMDRLSLRDLEPYERGVYDKRNIERIRDWVTDIDAGRRLLKLRSGGDVHYDKLLLATGSSPNQPQWDGLRDVKDGLVHFVSLQDLMACEVHTRREGRALVVGGGLIGIELVECLLYNGMHVTFLVREPWYWPAALDAEEGSMVTAHLKRHGVDVRLDKEVARIEADSAGRVTGLIAHDGERFECSLLGVAVGVHPAVDWLRNCTSQPDLARGIIVKPDFSTSLADVYAAGDCAEVIREGKQGLVEQIWYSARRQGELAARSMLGDAVEYRPPVFFNSSKFFEIEYTTVGDVTRAPAGARSFYFRVTGREASVRLVEADGRIVGFNMLGSRWEHTFFERWIEERRTLDEVVARLHEAQFDVEFGRLDLAPLRAEFRRWRSQQS